MLYFSKGKIFSILIALLIGFMLALPNALPNSFMGVEPKPVTTDDPVKLAEFRAERNKARESWWPGLFPKNKVNLGLDLQGGVYLLVELDPEEVVANQITNARADVTNDFGRQPKIFSKRTAGEGELEVGLNDPSQLDAAMARLDALNAPLEGSLSGCLLYTSPSPRDRG